ncbi:hypothetical protein Q766_17870 [Flavobacterium subsaxonicum WB 4.1-42 = DSM 21790]|uniref:Uncharacterized protein n=1 Tax=Flavobacterium subsaxonicum WB 4.1-42 = DSM 21790 TaxID=1121898 RepID=A0A0A2MGN0_9FLAO|nr:hypothetical protein Q766_17870 [Flavobacterium subsaxonicum WB 4.1-42 = DSM 21790]
MPKTLTQKALLTLIAEVVLFIAPLLIQKHIESDDALYYYYIAWIALSIAINLALIIILIVNKPKNFLRYIPVLLLMPILPFAIFIFLISGRVC